MEIAQKTCDLLNKKASKVWDKDFMNKKIKKVCRKSAINGESIVYVDYDETNNIPINEIISKNDIIFGDENEEEMQKKVAALSAQFTPEELCSAERVLLALGTLL